MMDAYKETLIMGLQLTPFIILTLWVITDYWNNNNDE